MKRVYYICGVPWVGKTSVIEWIAEREGYSVIPEFFQECPDYFISLTVHVEKKLRKSAIDWAFDQNVKKEYGIRDARGPILCDRSPLDLATYSLAFGEDIHKENMKKMKQVLWNPGELIFLLPPQSDELKRRIQVRDGLGINQCNKIEAELIIPLEEKFEQCYSLDGVHRVATDRHLEEVAEAVTTILGKSYKPININAVIRGLANLSFQERFEPAAQSLA